MKQVKVLDRKGILTSNYAVGVYFCCVETKIYIHGVKSLADDEML